MNKVLILGASLLILMPLANAEVYKYIDEKGNVSYSSIPPKPGATPVKNLPPVSTYEGGGSKPAAQPAPPVQTNAPAEANGANDAKRQQLQQQLNSERKALADAQKALAEGKTVRLGSERNYVRYQERIKGLEDAVQARQNRVNALQQQLKQ